MHTQSYVSQIFDGISSLFGRYTSLLVSFIGLLFAGYLTYNGYVQYSQYLSRSAHSAYLVAEKVLESKVIDASGDRTVAHTTPNVYPSREQVWKDALTEFKHVFDLYP